MIFFKWNSQLPFGEIKAKIKERKKAAPEKPAHRWDFLRLWRFLLIHYVGPAYIHEYASRSVPTMHHMLVLGFCFSRAGKTKYVGLRLYDYVEYLIFPPGFFFSIYYGSGSWLISGLVALTIACMLEFMSREPAKELLLGIKLYLGFDPK